MTMNFLPVFAVALMVAGCNRQHGQPANGTVTQAQAVTSSADGNPEPVEPAMSPPASASVPAQAARTSSPSPVPDTTPPISARVVDERPRPREAGAEASHSADSVIPARTRIRVRLGESLNSKNSRVGERFSAYLDEPIISGDRVVVPKGTLFRGHVVEAKSSGRLRGRAYLGVTLDSFRLHGATYAIATAPDVRASGSHKKRNAIAIGGGSGTGAAIGGIAGGGVGALIGAGAGAAAGTTGAFITGRKNVRLPVETPLVFSLRNEVTVRG